MSLLARTLSIAAAAVLAGSLAVAPAQADTLDVAPPGANDWSCKPSAEHPYPVILVPGTFESMAKNWSTLSPYLKSAGYCVFALNYGETNGVYATAPVANSAQELAPFVDAVRASTGAKKVDLVGHSQGGMMPRYYMGFLGGANNVNKLIGIAPSNHGTEGVIVPPPGLCRGSELHRPGLCSLRRPAGGLGVHAEAQLHRRHRGWTVVHGHLDGPRRSGHSLQQPVPQRPGTAGHEHHHPGQVPGRSLRA